MGERCIGLTESYRGGDSVNDSIDVDDDDPSEDMGIAVREMGSPYSWQRNRCLP